jgi:hypothetical protein
MKTENWDDLQNLWKGEKKPSVDINELKAEVRSRKIWKTFNFVNQAVIVIAVILLTIHRITDQTSTFDYIILGQLWFITILALIFNIWNRSSLRKEDSFSLTQYLNLLLSESLKKKRTALFVLALTVLNLLFYVILFLTGFISFSNITVTLSAIGILLIYTAWSLWYYKTATSDIDHYQEELRKITET